MVSYCAQHNLLVHQPSLTKITLLVTNGKNLTLVLALSETVQFVARHSEYVPECFEVWDFFENIWIVLSHLSPRKKKVEILFSGQVQPDQAPRPWLNLTVSDHPKDRLKRGHEDNGPVTNRDAWGALFFLLLPYFDDFTFCLPCIPVDHHAEVFSAPFGALWNSQWDIYGRQHVTVGKPRESISTLHFLMTNWVPGGTIATVVLRQAGFYMLTISTAVQSLAYQGKDLSIALQRLQWAITTLWMSFPVLVLCLRVPHDVYTLGISNWNQCCIEVIHWPMGNHLVPPLSLFSFHVSSHPSLSTQRIKVDTKVCPAMISSIKANAKSGGWVQDSAFASRYPGFRSNRILGCIVEILRQPKSYKSTRSAERERHPSQCSSTGILVSLGVRKGQSWEGKDESNNREMNLLSIIALGGVGFPALTEGVDKSRWYRQGQSILCSRYHGLSSSTVPDEIMKFFAMGIAWCGCAIME